MAAAPAVRYGTGAGRWVLLATVLGSGVAFLDATVVNVALPAIGTDLAAGFSVLQWVLDAYLLALGALVLVGGVLGDIYGRRRVFVAGLLWFLVASIGCGLAPTAGVLIAARALQGVGAALLVPGSLAILTASFVPEDRARAVGAWSGLAGVASAVGPSLGGYLIDAVSWRLVFLLNIPLVGIAVGATLRHLPDTDARRRGRHRPVDLPGAALAAAGLGLVVFPLIEARRLPVAQSLGLGAAGLGLLAAFLAVERGRAEPMLPLGLFRSRPFTTANLATFAVWGALGVALFLVVLELQRALGYSALEAGAALLPITVLLLLLSPPVGRLVDRVGPRLLMTAGPLTAALGLTLMTRIGPGTSYVGSVLPAAATFGLGMAMTVTPVTATVLGAVDDARVGLASGVSNAVARIGALIAVAVIPLLAGLVGGTGSNELSPAQFTAGFHRAMLLAAGLCATGGVVALVGLPRRRVRCRTELVGLGAEAAAGVPVRQ